MLDEPQGGYLSAGAAEELESRHNPLDAVRAVAEPREEGLPETGNGANAPASGETSGIEGGDYGDFDWPDGYTADPAALAKFVPLARELGLPREGAQKLAHLYAELDQERVRAQARFIAANNGEWLHEIRNHPEFGGRNLERTGTEVASMLRRFGSPLLTAQIRQMNIQNWPEMFYFLARVSQVVNEDCSPSGTAAAGPAKSTAQILFPGLK